MNHPIIHPEKQQKKTQLFGMNVRTLPRLVYSINRDRARSAVHQYNPIDCIRRIYTAGRSPGRQLTGTLYSRASHDKCTRHLER